LGPELFLDSRVVLDVVPIDRQGRGRDDFKKEGRCGDQKNALPKGDPAALP
jgi:hypothetical protein